VFFSFPKGKEKLIRQKLSDFRKGNQVTNDKLVVFRCNMRVNIGKYTTQIFE